MTIIAAYIDDTGRTAIGCDTRVQDSTLRTEVATKLVRIDQAIVGSCGTPLWRRFLRGYNRGMTCMLDVERLADAWLAWAQERKHGEGTDGVHYQTGQLLVALPGAVYEVTSDGCVLKPSKPYAAIGSGQAVASGALHAALVAGMDCLGAVSTAVEAAILHAPGCGGDAVVEEVAGSKGEAT